MPHIHILAVGKMKGGGFAEVFAEYEKRLKWPITCREFDLKETNPTQLQKKESIALLEAVPDDAYIVALDPRGKALDSLEFAHKLEHWESAYAKNIAFLIGGANGHTDALRKKAHFLLSFGVMTWPHRLARVMLAEQFYRAQQILAGHPYHRE